MNAHAKPSRWSPQQDAVLKAVARWLRDPNAPTVFTLSGYAGTGKTTLARHLAEGVDGKVLFGAFTGKAALVMRNKGCVGASTLHSLIYSVDDDADGLPVFRLNPDSDVAKARLVIVDEVSMVGEDLGADLLSFGTKVLALGDPAQLPPVKGAGYFTTPKPDVMLTEIHRQAQDSPIIALATAVREGRPLIAGRYGESVVCRRDAINLADALAHDQVLCGLNRTRRAKNAQMREALGFAAPTPMAGERLICLRNSREKGLLNGGLWRCQSAEIAGDEYTLRVASEDIEGLKADVKTHRMFFDGSDADTPWPERRAYDEFDFGYALTTHKAQGSQWDSVLVLNEAAAFREDKSRWLYTAITRAAQRVTVTI